MSQNCLKKENIISCSCGKNANTSGTSNVEHCFTKPGSKYSSRCLCLKNEVACNDNCGCRCCRNPFGQHKDISSKSAKGRPRKRARHDMSTTRNTGAKFMQEKDENGKVFWSRLERYVFESLLAEMRIRRIEINENNLLIYFNHLVKVVCSAASILPVILTKSLLQIKERLEEHNESSRVWLSAYWKRQFERNTKKNDDR